MCRGPGTRREEGKEGGKEEGSEGGREGGREGKGERDEQRNIYNYFLVCCNYSCVLRKGF